MSKTSPAQLDAETLKGHAITALEDTKAQDIATLDVRGISDVADFLLIATGTSDRHVGAVARNLVDDLRDKHGERPIGVEGEGSGADWILIDYGVIIVHVMREETRSYYDLDTLWGERARELLLQHQQQQP
ncbi:unnamed protein product [Cyprideis torosa]|uniref:Uncharacterized protein n=1 Tax=Cyprideis torosa TaxID=163714 RepID=A0A7R8WQN4_9CRUS|nr:unnamed protein product [Cyprideis torosa]CAG0908118.1 unnamed protein product [Cyprideis torosa]